jgi:hypothetical protein
MKSRSSCKVASSAPAGPPRNDSVWPLPNYLPISPILPQRNLFPSRIISYLKRPTVQGPMTPPMIETAPGHYVILDHGEPIGEVPLPERKPVVGVGEKTVFLVIRPVESPESRV